MARDLVLSCLLQLPELSEHVDPAEKQGSQNWVDGASPSAVLAVDLDVVMRNAFGALLALQCLVLYWCEATIHDYNKV